MNNDELKKKIVEVLKPVIRAGNISCNEENACKKCWFPCEIERTAGRLADALIAAGIGDVKEAELERKAYEVASNQYRIWFEEQQDRAKVAERALVMACANMVKDEKSDVNIECVIRVLYYKYLKQAEKELAEEAK